MQQLGVKNIILSSVFKADRDEVIDFMQVNASLGNDNAIKELISKLKNKGTYDNHLSNFKYNYLCT